MKKAQVTTFIVLGIVIVATFFVILYLVNSITTQKLSNEQSKVLIGILEASAIYNFEEVCVNEALKQGLLLIGQQGGIIDLTDYDYVEHEGSNVTYGIKFETSDNPDWPAYPCTCFYPNRAGFPCSGALGEPDYCRYPNGNYELGRKTFAFFDEGIFSVKSQLERFVLKKSNECLKELIESEEYQLPYGLTIDANKSSARVVFSSTATAVKLNFPVTIQGEPATQFVQWDARENVRLKLIYDVVNDILRKDSIYVNYNLTENSGSMYQEFFEKERNLFFDHQGKIKFRKKSMGGKEVLIFNDSLSTIDGQPYVFKTARQKRPPALKWINQNASLNDDYDYLVIEGEKIDLEMKADDPDEEPITYLFSGDLVSGSMVGKRFVYQTRENDFGYYNITAKVSDGLYHDLQKVRVLVDRKLKSNFTIGSVYGGFSDNVSLEDPIRLDATSTPDSLDPGILDNYSWRLPEVDFESEKECLILPNRQNCGVLQGISPENIKSQLTEQIGNGTAGSITLWVFWQYNGREQQDSEAKQFEIKDCIPYRNPSSPAYPYHTAVDPFYANHTCCLSDYTIAPNTTVCFKNSTLTVKCDGLRGNICAGEKVEVG